MSNDSSRIILNQEKKIIEIYFEGDIGGEEYKKIWFDALYQAKVNRIHSFFIDQSKIDKVKFSSRYWFLVEMIPLIKIELKNKVFAYIKASKTDYHSFNLKFMIKSVSTFTSFKTKLVNSKEEAYKLNQ